MKSILAILVLLLLLGCTQTEEATKGEMAMEEITVESNSFSEGEEIPAEYTCQGNDVSPHLKWSAVDGAKTYALLVEDPDAPMGTWIHWKIVDIPAEKTELKEGEVAGEAIVNSFGGTAYGGPCPPSGRHRYFFKVFALSTELENVTAENFDSLVAEHAIAKGQIMGTYEKK